MSATVRLPLLSPGNKGGTSATPEMTESVLRDGPDTPNDTIAAWPGSESRGSPKNARAIRECAPVSDLRVQTEYELGTKWGNVQRPLR
jgi:hypothetical protein